MSTWISPAKLNLYLAVTGIRESDGFHELDSLVTLLDFGDTLTLTRSTDGGDHFSCNTPELAWDSRNLLYQALERYRSICDYDVPLTLELEKRIPFGAGLGGGSSNASTLLLALNSLNPEPLPVQRLRELSAELGSDCPLFFYRGLLRMRGRGEQIEQINGSLEDQLRNRSVLVFHPGFPVSAAWAYQQLRQGYPSGYTAHETVAQELQHWLCHQRPWYSCARNDLSPVVDHKYVAIPTLRAELRERFGLESFMSGSGSACFAWIDSKSDSIAVTECIRECWGPTAWIQLCRIITD